MEIFGLAAAPVALAALVAAALSMDRHHRALFARPCPARLRKRLRRTAGAGFLAATAIAAFGGAIGLVAGVLSCGLAAGLVLLALTIRG